MKEAFKLENGKIVHNDLTFDEYQELANTTAVYPDQGSNLIYPALGLNGEAGEVAEHAKKMIRDDDGALTLERREALIKEVGDVMWYMAALCTELGIQMGDVAARNYQKLKSRQERNKLHGSGDDR